MTQAEAIREAFSTISFAPGEKASAQTVVYYSQIMRLSDLLKAIANMSIGETRGFLTYWSNLEHIEKLPMVGLQSWNEYQQAGLGVISIILRKTK